ncbi:MAG: orotate phosphoribosyltransferase [Methanolinea sp.]|nr:orotate phosphoribosyltransferase [Methanolinea sp.]
MVNEIAKILRENGAVEFGEFTLASGAKSNYYLDVKTAMTKPVVLSEIAKSISGRFTFDVVAGVAVGGVPLATAVSLASKRPFAIIRSQEKSHGKGGRIIGHVEGRHVLLVEDVTTSGSSALYGAKSLRDEGAVVETVVTVVDREAGAAGMLGREGLSLVALARASEILEA